MSANLHTSSNMPIYSQQWSTFYRKNKSWQANGKSEMQKKKTPHIYIIIEANKQKKAGGWWPGNCVHMSISKSAEWGHGNNMVVLAACGAGGWVRGLVWGKLGSTWEVPSLIPGTCSPCLTLSDAYIVKFWAIERKKKLLCLHFISVNKYARLYFVTHLQMQTLFTCSTDMWFISWNVHSTCLAQSYNNNHIIKIIIIIIIIIFGMILFFFMLKHLYAFILLH